MEPAPVIPGPDCPVCMVDTGRTLPGEKARVRYVCTTACFNLSTPGERTMIDQIAQSQQFQGGPNPAPAPVIPPPPQPNPAFDALNTQVGGDHYRSMRIQPLEYIVMNDLSFAEGSIVKYVSRWRKKGGVQDLKKARQTLDVLIELEEKKSA